MDSRLRGNDGDKQAVVAGIGVAPQNERRPIRELRIGQSVDGKTGARRAWLCVTSEVQ